MNSITIAILLVRCSADLMVCETLPGEHLRYASMETCRSEVARTVSMKNSGQKGDVWMGKCFYRIAQADPRRAHRHEVFASGGLLRTAGVAQ